MRETIHTRHRASSVLAWLCCWLQAAGMSQWPTVQTMTAHAPT